MNKGMIGKKVRVINKHVLRHEGQIEGIIIQYEIDEAKRETIRIKVTKGNTALTDYFITDVEIVE